MYIATELDVNGRLLRGNVRMPDKEDFLRSYFYMGSRYGRQGRRGYMKNLQERR